MADQRVTIFHIQIPLKRNFSTADGAVTSRSVALVRFGEGPFGWGEAAPYPGQDESLDLVMRAAREERRTPTLQAALDEASEDYQARLLDVPLSTGLDATKDVLTVSLAVGLSDPLEAVERGIGEGVQRFKLKIEPGRLDHVGEVRRRFGEVLIGLDANGSFDGSTVAELALLSDLDIAYLEQPVSDLASDAARSVSSFVDAPIFADESVRFAADADAVLDLDHVAGVVVKPGRLGWAGAVAVRALAKSRGKLWRASGLLETGIGRAYTDTLGACPDGFISDIAPASWFLEADIALSRYKEGNVLIPTGPGLGVEPIPEMIDRYLVERLEFSE